MVETKFIEKKCIFYVLLTYYNRNGKFNYSDVIAWKIYIAIGD